MDLEAGADHPPPRRRRGQRSGFAPSTCTFLSIKGSAIPEYMWPRGVTASTLDPESSNRGSNPRKALVALLLFVAWRGVCRAAAALHATPPALIEAWPSTIEAEARPPVTCAGWQPFASMLQPKLGVEVNTLTLDVSFRYSLAGQDTRPSPERPGLESRWRKRLSLMRGNRPQKDSCRSKPVEGQCLNGHMV